MAGFKETLAKVRTFGGLNKIRNSGKLLTSSLIAAFYIAATRQLQSLSCKPVVQNCLLVIIMMPTANLESHRLAQLGRYLIPVCEFVPPEYGLYSATESLLNWTKLKTQQNIPLISKPVLRKALVRRDIACFLEAYVPDEAARKFASRSLLPLSRWPKNATRFGLALER